MARTIEPSLLNIFRLFVAIRVVVIALFALRSLSWVGSAFETSTLLSFAISLMLLGYLFSDSLKQRFQNAYLPLALLVATALILGETRLFQWFINQSEFQNALPRFLGLSLLSASQNNAFPLLFIMGATTSLFPPVVLVSWQYHFRTAVIYILSTTLFDLILILILPTQADLGLELFGIFSRASSFMIVAFIISRLVATQRQQQAALEESNKTLARYATTQEKLAVSQERNRLARELHDTIAHTMSAVTVKLNAVDTLWERDPARAHTMLSEVIVAMGEGMVETRRALRDLRATPLDDMGLVLAVCHLAETAAERSGFTLQLHTPNKDLRLPPDVEMGIYRIAQEALNNVVKHANARTVRLSLDEDLHFLRLSVQDNGIGFDQKTAMQNGHLGLKGLYERAQMLGGELRLTSIPHQGTTIELCLEKSHDSRTHL